MKILITETQTELSGNGRDLITGLSLLVKALKKSDVPTEMIEAAVKTGLMTDEEMESEIKKIMKKRETKIELNNILKDMLKNLEKEI